MLFKRLSILFAGLLFALPAAAQTVRPFVTSLAGDRLAARPPLHFQPDKGGAPVFHIDEKTRDQEIVGFGASFLESGLICLNALDRPQQEQVFQALFDPARGAGFSAMKTVIGATDFMAAGPWYSYDDHPGDTAMQRFSIQRDLGPNGLIPYIRRARRHGQFVLQAPMDYPPDWMLFDLKKTRTSIRATSTPWRSTTCATSASTKSRASPSTTSASSTSPASTPKSPRKRSGIC